MSDSPTVTDEDIVAVFAETDQTYLRPLDVSQDLPLPPEELRERFDDLEERDLIVGDEDRGSGTAYRLSQDATDRVDLPDDVVTAVEAQAETGTGTETPQRDQEIPETQTPPPGESEAGEPYEYPSDVESFSPPGSPDVREERRMALGLAYEYVRDSGPVTRAELIESVFPQAPAGYEDPDTGWWADVIRPGLEHLPDVERTGGEGDEELWQFTGDAE